MENIINLLLGNNQILLTLLIISLTGLIGLYIGSFKIFKINIGITGVLFAGIILSYTGIKLNEEILHFIREFGLVLFIYAVGIQVGQGFFSSFRKNGLFYNLFTFIIVSLNVAITLLISFFSKIDKSVIIGMYCGGVTNTPALASAQATAATLNHPEIINNISSGYALTYPGTILSLVLSIILIRVLFKDECNRDIEFASQPKDRSKITNITVKVENKNLDNTKIKDIPAIDDLNIVVSRIKKGNQIRVAHPDDTINTGDLILAVGEEDNLNKFIKIVGSKSEENLKETGGKIIHTRVVVTKKDLIGKKISETKIPSYNVVITRVSRADREFIISDDYVIQLGDNIVMVGEEDDIKKAISLLGNSPKDLNYTDLVPIFIGIIAGIIIGAIPFKLPFITQSLKLGIAGGLLISAIIFANIGNIGKISWYIPPQSTILLRELGIIMFLAAVGLKSGKNFFEMLLSTEGLKIIALGLMISFIPIFMMGVILKKKYKLNYLTISGILSGSMTDPPALAFANSLADSNLPTMAYATVYPLTMFLRIISAQILVLIFYG